MMKTIKKFWMVAFLSALGCAQTPEKPPELTKSQKFQNMHPQERHIWLPPSEEELEKRRRNQKGLDQVAADLERLFMGYADILGDEIILENLLRGTEPHLQQLEAKLAESQAQHEQRIKELNQAVMEMEGDIGEMDSDLATLQKQQAARQAMLQKQRAVRKATKNDYRLAILLFRNGQYQKSIAAFKRILGKKHAPSLRDNILFGLASNFYKLKQYDQALAYLDTIIRNHSKGDKWLVSHAMSGLIYNFQGQYGKAVSILEASLKHRPNPDLLKIINRLLSLAQGGVVDASS
ncbi:MAG: tetratricopeptide repeat protein [Nitrospinae bacterium]|nr:tetratricopeptide repeat protein [Nitrospinota bacterium]